MVIKNGKVFGENGTFFHGTVTIADGKFAKITPDGGVAETIEDSGAPATEAAGSMEMDASGLYVIPGMVDIHLHGCVGYDFCDGTAEAFDSITRYQVQHGVTSVVPATMTLPREGLADIFRAAGKYAVGNYADGQCVAGENVGIRSTICGITMEGPFVSLEKKGAQNGAYIHVPDVEFYREMQELSGGLIKQVAVAPEEDADLAFIREVSKETVISVAHTTATYDTAHKAFAAGATHVTHLFNAMPGFHHREPGVVGAAYDHKNVFVELICDNVHIHPAMVRAMFKLFGAERICMISDSMMATGMADGSYSLGGQAVTVGGRRATLADGTIAGSASNLYDCLRVAVLEMGIPPEEAVLACTLTPARALGLEDICGSISVGKSADLVLLDDRLNIKMVVKNGKVIVGR